MAAGAQVRPVRSRSDLRNFMGVHNAAYGTDRSAAEFLYEVLASLPLADDAPMQHLVLWAAGTPVAVASVFLDCGVAGLYNVATRPGVRSRGFGTGAARAALSAAYERGVRTAVLGAEPEAAGLYRTLGFTDAGLLHRMRYALRPQASPGMTRGA
jgi:ribosomal protein S18 acetylase RimI-like enzyme